MGSEEATPATTRATIPMPVAGIADRTKVLPKKVGVTVFPAEIYRPPRIWGERAFGNLIYWHEADKGGHFAAWEQPEISSQELRAAFRSLRDQEVE